MLKQKIFLRIAAVLLLLLVAPPVFSAVDKDNSEKPVTIEADSIAYDEGEDAFHAVGKVRITFSRGFLKADTVTLYRSTNMALAEGEVLVQNDQDLLEGEKVWFNIESKIGTVNEGKIFIASNHLYIKGERIEKRGDATYQLENCTVTTCDGESPDWRLAGSKLNVTIDGYGVLNHGRLLAKNVPILYSPYFVFPAKTTRQSGLLPPYFFYSQEKNGLDVELPFYWAISERVDATFYQRYMEKRGFKEGVEFRYYPNEDSFGSLYVDYIKDSLRVTETVGATSRDWQEDQKRWSFYLNHQSTISPGFTIRSDIQRVSDKWYFKDFSSSNYYLDHYTLTGLQPFQRVAFLGDASLASLNSTVRLAKDWSLYNLTALASYTDDFSAPNNNYTIQAYPVVYFTGFRQPVLDSPLQLDLNSGYEHAYRYEGQKGHFWWMNPTAYLPMELGQNFQGEYSVGFRGTGWDTTDSLTDYGDKHGSRGMVQLGAWISTEFNRVFTVGTPGSAGVEKIRHAIRPAISYGVIPYSPQDNPPDFLGGAGGVYEVLSYSLTNSLVSRVRGEDGTVTYREMMRLMLAQSYNILESRRDVPEIGSDRRPFGDVVLELDLTPVQYVAIAARNIYRVNSGEWAQSNYDLTLLDNRGDYVSAGYRYTKDTLQEINLYLKASLTSSVDAIYILRRNLLDKKTIESTYGIKYRKQCWMLEFNVTSVENDITVMAYVSLVGLGGGGGAVALPGAGRGAPTSPGVAK